MIALAIMAVLRWLAPALYDHLLLAWGVEPYAWPFLDTDTVLSAVRCLRAGVDVFQANPCDPLGRVFDYSPLWLVLAALPITTAWTAPLGLLVVAGYFGSLLLLPAARSRRDALIVVAAVLSSASAFAVERGNNDLVLFALAAGAAALVCRSAGWRLIGYGAALLAGLLKYYPMALLALASRERPARLGMVAIGVVAVIAVFLLIAGHDLARALALIPHGSWFGDMFGASTLAGGLGQLGGWSTEAQGTLRWGMALASIATAPLLAVRSDIGEDLSRLTERERAFLLAGAMMVLGCFFTAQNIGYRAVHLVLVVPSLLALARISARREYRWGLAATLALLWSQGWTMWLGWSGSAELLLVGWVVDQALWWGVVTLLATLAAGLLLQSELARALLPRRPSAKPISAPA